MTKIIFIFLFVLPVKLFAGGQPNYPESLISIQYLPGDKIQDFSEAEMTNKMFTAYKNETLSPNVYYWFRLTFDNQKLNKDSYFIHFNDFFAEIQLVQVLSESKTLKYLGGSYIPLSNRSFEGFFKDKVLMTKTRGTQTTVYLRVKRAGFDTLSFPSMNIISLEDYQHFKTKTDIVQSFFTGVIAILCLFNLVLFLLTREKLYLSYFIYIAIASLYFFFYYGYIELFWFPQHPLVNKMFFFSILLAQPFYFFFLHYALNEENFRDYRKLIFRYASVILSLSVVVIIISLFRYSVAIHIGDVLSVVNGIAIVLIFFLLIRKVPLTVKIILSGSLFLAAGGGAAIIANLFYISVEHIYIYQVGFYIEILLFAIAINFTHNNERLIRIKRQLDITQLKNEKLEKERELEGLSKAIDKKNRDLTYKAIVISQKESMQKTILKQLSKLKDQEKIQKSQLLELMSNLKSNTNNNHWNEFESHFTTVHPHFYSALNKKYQNLTASENKLCAFIKMKLSSKEIALITGKSQQSVDVARSRLRKKMGLANHENLYTVISEIEIQ
ncbi:7TM diverse intracellular signaling domain-containing protein [Maribellus comscasis]|nr:7TM diverse intracellular signaling domain-containing protein [Maribellus comscasis]